MKNYKVMLSAVIPGMMVLTSCSDLPQQQINEAQAAIENAKTVGAQTYVPENFFALEDSMAVVMSMINEQEGKFFKNYEQSVAKLEAVEGLANEVAASVETKKQEIKTDIVSIITEVKTSIEESKVLIAEAPKGKDGAAALLAMKGELEALEISLTESGSLVESNDLIAAMEKANVTKTKAQQINTELKEVMSNFKSSKI